jgi:hypothetical protein
MVVAFILGTLPTGPLYVAFPFARTLRFLGWRFMTTRLVLSIVFVTLMAIVIDRGAKTDASAAKPRQ